MSSYFISDTHFGHDNIIKLADRQFSTVGEMDERLISNWNEVVGPNDTVFPLGDFSFRSIQGAEFYGSRLKGESVLFEENTTLTPSSSVLILLSLYRTIRKLGFRISL